jgi:glycyl-tRNA synthetase (class II)
MSNKVYLGDGAYAEYDGFSLILTTYNGIEDTNTIYLEPELFQNLEEFVRKLRNELEASGKVL